MDTVRTVSDTKRDFYTYHTRPINSIYRRVIEELMVEMHLLSVNVNFNYDSIFALGVVTAYERFMAGYQPEQDQESIFQALCRSVGRDPQQFRHDAEQLRSTCNAVTVEQLGQWSSALVSQEGAQLLYDTLTAIAFNQTFKYSRLFAIGLYSVVEAASENGTVSQDLDVLKEMGEALHLPIEKLSKDLDLYRSNLEKLAQAREVLKDVMEADRKKRQQQSLEKTQPVDQAGS